MIRIFLLFALLPTSGFAALQTVEAAGNVIPQTRAGTLTGTTVDLPKDLQGRVAVLVVGFTRGSQDGVRVWGKRLAQDYRNSPQVMCFEAAMLAEVPRLARGLVIRAMKKDVSPGAQEHFLILTGDDAAWRRAAGYEGVSRADEAYVLLVDDKGVVQWRDGPQGHSTKRAMRN